MITAQARKETKDRLKAIMAKGIRIEFIVLMTGINKYTIYSLTSTEKPISEEKIDKINSAIDKLERMIKDDWYIVEVYECRQFSRVY